ncbi:MAG: hypothetical protein ACP5FN_04050, partial [Candidatus Micrarchaeia archaeon]
QQKPIQFAPNMKGKINNATYQSVKEAIIQHVQKTFQDGHAIAQSLKDDKKVDLSKSEPVRQMSIADDAVVARIEQSGFESSTRNSSGIILNAKIIFVKVWQRHTL